MKISTRGRYGLEALLDLAVHSAEGHASLKSIAERCGISEAYILQIFLVLRRNGIVESVRGAQGGYRFAREPWEITVGDVLRALEGPLTPVACILPDTDKPCDRYEKCTTRVLWQRVRDNLDKVVDSITIADLKEKHERMCLNKENMEYTI